MEEVEGLSPSSSTKFEGNNMTIPEQSENSSPPQPVLVEDIQQEWTPKRFPGSKPRIIDGAEIAPDVTTKPDVDPRALGDAISRSSWD